MEIEAFRPGTGFLPLLIERPHPIHEAFFFFLIEVVDLALVGMDIDFLIKPEVAACVIQVAVTVDDGQRQIGQGADCFSDVTKSVARIKEQGALSAHNQSTVYVTRLLDMEEGRRRFVRRKVSHIKHLLLTKSF